MWDAYSLGNEDFLWTCINFMGGIAEQQQAPCGGVSAAAVCLGLRYRCPLTDKDGAKQARRNAREDAGEIVKSFNDKYGTIICRDLLGFNFSDTDARQKALDSGEWGKKCDGYIQFLLEKLYELDEKRGICGNTQTTEAGSG